MGKPAMVRRLGTARKTGEAARVGAGMSRRFTLARARGGAHSRVQNEIVVSIEMKSSSDRTSKKGSRKSVSIAPPLAGRGTDCSPETG
ncbi:hypothetical protein WN73_33820 [Bradyrhizobium sp. CCBAU 45394]|jgi:hypothetical protein|nr:hypothetical protein [Bradyrhizobium sp. CCBAU 45394]